MSKFFDRLKKGLEEANAYESGKKTLRSKLIDIPKPPPHYSAKRIQKIRTGILNCSQAVFAMILGVSIKTVQAWETGERIPNHTAMRLLELIENGIFRPDLDLESAESA